MAMDLSAVTPYMQRQTMNWLLILSALFSTLTGVGTGVRPVEAAVQCSASSAVVGQHVAAPPLRTSGHVHLLGAFGIPAGFAWIGGVARRTAASPRLYLDRPRA